MRAAQTTTSLRLRQTTLTQFAARKTELLAQLTKPADPVQRAMRRGKLARLLSRSPWHELPGDPTTHTHALRTRIAAEDQAAHRLDPQLEWLFGQADAILDFLQFEQATQAADTRNCWMGATTLPVPAGA